jgi:hypothetical protein
MFIVETIEITPTPTSIADLLTTAGRTDHVAHEKCQAISLRVDEASDAVIYISDANTQTPVKLLNPSELQPYSAHYAYDVRDVILHASSTISVGIVISG